MYQDSYKTLPPSVLIPNGVGWTDENNAGPPWTVLILPFIEQSNLYNLVQPSIVNQLNKINDQNWRNLSDRVVKTYRCPSEANIDTLVNRAGRNWARGNYGANAGPGDPTGGTGNPQAVNIAGGNYNGWGYSGGPMMVNVGRAIERVEDGSANVIMVNHLRAAPNGGDMRGTWAFPMPGCSYTANHAVGDAYGPNDTGCCSDDLAACTDRPDIAMGCWNGGWGQGEARSAHTGQVIAAMCDGSVRTFRSSVSQQTWYWINSANDGQTWTDQ